MTTDFLTVREVARLFGKHENTVYRWVAENRLPVIRLSHEILFPREKIMAIVEGRLPSAVELSIGTEAR